MVARYNHGYYLVSLVQTLYLIVWFTHETTILYWYKVQVRCDSVRVSNIARLSHTYYRNVLTWQVFRGRSSVPSLT